MQFSTLILDLLGSYGWSSVLGRLVQWLVKAVEEMRSNVLHFSSAVIAPKCVEAAQGVGGPDSSFRSAVFSAFVCFLRKNRH